MDAPIWWARLWCRLGLHKLAWVTIKWHDGGPYMEWHACRRCGKINDIADQVKDWPPFTMVFD